VLRAVATLSAVPTWNANLLCSLLPSLDQASGILVANLGGAPSALEVSNG
jgi:hypothetical protein